MFIVKYATQIGKTVMNLEAGQIKCATVDAAKPIATDLMLRRNLRNVQSATIVDDDGTAVALANPAKLKLARPQFEWLTVRQAKPKK